MAAPTYTDTLGDMYTTTWQLRLSKLENQIFNATPFYYLMQKNGRRSNQSGGRWIEEPLEYATNPTVRGIGKGEAVTLRQTEHMTTTHWDWKYITGHILRYFVDEQQNAGKSKQIGKVTADIDNLRNSVIDYMETKLFADGTDDSGKAPDGLANIVDVTNTTGTIGGLNKANYSWWRNNVTSMSGEAASVYLIKRMRTMFNDCGQLGDGVSRFPDLIVTDQATYELYEEECLAIGRIQMPDKGMQDLGFGELAFKGRPITWSPSCTAGYMYFLNTKNLRWIVDPSKWLRLGDAIKIYDQIEDKVHHLVAVGNLVCNNLKRQGVIHTIAE
tara:strand:+ start:884 stop:1870 length:987 start_codon:yes stop_codon:yes gene_type:complete